jgi:hypothetical protein
MIWIRKMEGTRWMCGCADVKMCGCEDVQMEREATGFTLQASGMCGCEDVQMCGWRERLQALSFRLQGCADF